ncbi:MAG TPA: hypothetical protein VFQ88_10610 [Nevskiaceae bacterium]|nr:hypothetical protein [Nevskiaceae bacterium]
MKSSIQTLGAPHGPATTPRDVGAASAGLSPAPLVELQRALEWAAGALLAAAGDDSADVPPEAPRDPLIAVGYACQSGALAPATQQQLAEAVDAKATTAYARGFAAGLEAAAAAQVLATLAAETVGHDSRPRPDTCNVAELRATQRRFLGRARAAAEARIKARLSHR